MNNQPITRDERTDVVENVSYRFAYLVMSFGLLAIVAYRSFIFQESNWDLLGLVLLGGATATWYQKTQKVLSRRWMMLTFATIVFAGIIALAIVLLRWK